MLNKKKIINDPVYGFITLPYNSSFDIIQNPWFQRLRRIQQLGLSSLVYPSAVHTRFQHTVGALHLMGLALEVLKSKGVAITEEECEAACIAILMHDIGHGPFSHGLENSLVPVHHEEISKLIMQEINKTMEGKMGRAIEIFSNRYSKKFLNQLVSSQLDVDRLDYLNRDSFFTGVAEGVIGYDRIIKMLAVSNGELVVEEKGIYSIEKFLISRRIMYWQVYLHKTAMAAEQMLLKIVERAKYLAHNGHKLFASPALEFFLKADALSIANGGEWLNHFAQLDDTDLYSALKVWQQNEDKVLAYLCSCLINRRLFKLEFRKTEFTEEELAVLRKKIAAQFKNWSNEELEYLLFTGSTSNSAYNTLTGQIYLLQKDGNLVDIASASDQLNISTLSAPVLKHYVCYVRV